MPNIRKNQKTATKKKLIRHAKELIVTKGVDDLQISDITESAGVSQGTFYVHFESKEELFNLLKDEFSDNMLKMIVAVFENEFESDGKLSVRHLANIYLDELRNNRVFIILYASRYGYSLPYEQLITGINPALIDYIAKEVDKLQAYEDRESFDSVLFTHALLSIWLRVGFRYSLLEAPDKEEHVSMIYRFTKAAVLDFLPEQGKKQLGF